MISKQFSKTSIFIPLLLVGLSCGKHESKEDRPCEIDLRYSATLKNNTRDVVKYDSHAFSQSCESYRGENVRRLHYKLKINAKPSVGELGFISLRGRTANLDAFSLAGGSLEIVNLLQDDWVGPLDEFNGIYFICAFPENTEKVLYPTEVKLIIDRR